MAFDTAAKLSLTVHLLCAQYEETKAALQRQIDSMKRQYPASYDPAQGGTLTLPRPEETLDNNGRSVLLDALCAIAQAETALLNAERR